VRSAIRGGAAGSVAICDATRTPPLRAPKIRSRRWPIKITSDGDTRCGKCAAIPTAGNACKMVRGPCHNSQGYCPAISAIAYHVMAAAPPLGINSTRKSRSVSVCWVRLDMALPNCRLGENWHDRASVASGGAKPSRTALRQVRWLFSSVWTMPRSGI